MVDAEKYTAAIFRRGQKQELFGDGDENQGASELEYKLDELLDVWSLPRTGKDLAAAIWRPQHKAAEVVLQRGRLFNHIGFMWGKKLFLHPEEALYLVDRANLLVFEDTSATGKRLLSIQECQELMLQTGVTMDMFLMYCKFMRAGYIVQRHPFTWVVKNSESPTEIWSPSIAYDSSTNRLALGGIPSQIVKGNSSLEEDVKEEEERATKRQKRRQEVASSAAAAGGETKNKKKKSGGEEKSSSWWSATTTNDKTTSTKRNPWAGLVDQTTLPRCIVKEPAIHRALTLFPNMQPLHHLQPSEVVDLGIANEDGAKMLQFDVFAANSQFSRKFPDPPLYSICVCDGECPPSLLANNAADQAANGIPVRYSGVEHGDISYFAIARAELHKILT